MKLCACNYLPVLTSQGLNKPGTFEIALDGLGHGKPPSRADQRYLYQIDSSCCALLEKSIQHSTVHNSRTGFFLYLPTRYINKWLVVFKHQFPSTARSEQISHTTIGTWATREPV